MPSSNVVGADAKEKQNVTEKEEVKIIVYLDVIFSLLNCTGIASRNDNPTALFNISIADIVSKHVYYKSNKKIIDNAEKVFFHDFLIPCEDLFFNKNLTCIDSDNAILKIANACEEIEEYVDNLAINNESNVQIYINILGFEAIDDIAWGFASFADANCLNNVEDERIGKWIREDYNPLFFEKRQEGWQVSVSCISLLDHGLIFEINKTQKNTLEPSLSKNDNQLNSTTAFQISNPRESEGKATEDIINLSEFISFNHAIKFLSDPELSVIEKQDKEKEDNHTGVADSSFQDGNKNETVSQETNGNSTLKHIHNALEIASFVPAVSSASGLIDSALYAGEEVFLLFNGGNDDEIAQLQRKAVYSLLFAIPFFKAGKAIKNLRVIKKGKDVQKLLGVSQAALKQANRTSIRQSKSIASKRAKQVAKNRVNMAKRRVAEAKKQYQEIKPEFDKALKSQGMTYKEHVDFTKETVLEKFFTISKFNMPLLDIGQAATGQYIIPGTITRNNINTIKDEIQFQEKPDK